MYVLKFVVVGYVNLHSPRETLVSILLMSYVNTKVFETVNNFNWFLFIVHYRLLTFRFDIASSVLTRYITLCGSYNSMNTSIPPLHSTTTGCWLSVTMVLITTTLILASLVACPLYSQNVCTTSKRFYDLSWEYASYHIAYMNEKQYCMSVV